MADEIRMQALLQVTNGDITAKMYDNILVDQGSPGVHQYSQWIGPTEEEVFLGAVVTPRMLYLQNASTNDYDYIDVGPDSGGMVPLIRLWAGEIAMMPLYPGITLKAICNDGTATDAVELVYMITET